MLSDLNYSDLFGKDHTAQAARLVTTINRLLGEEKPDPATALAAVEQATSADRVALLKRLTKEMLLDPSRRIELDDLVSQETQRVLTALKDKERVSAPLGNTTEEQIVRIAEEARALWALSEPFCASLRIASRWGAPESLTPWAGGIRSFVAAALKPENGNSALIQLRHLPGMMGIFTAALACASSGNWANLKSLVVDPSVRDRSEQKPTSVIEATDPHSPFGSTTEWVTNTLARAAMTEQALHESLKDFTERRQGKYHTPVAEWMHHVLRPIFSDQWPDDDAYSAEFDRAEVVLGTLAQDVVNVRAAANPEGRSWGRSHWYGRSTWRSHSHGNAVADLVHELETQGTQWRPLRGGLFGGDEDRARAALEAYQTTFNNIASRRF